MTNSRENQGYPGLFIVIDGPDGAGKLTQARILQKYIQDQSKYTDVLMTHEPWQSGEIKRKLESDSDAYSEGWRMAELYVEDRARHTHLLIRPVLKTGGIVIGDRYKMSTCAYQWVQGVDLGKLLELHEHRGILMPDITLLFSLKEEVATERIAARQSALEKFEKDKMFTKRIVEAYSALGHMAQVDENVFGKVEIIDANKTAEEVSKEMIKKFEPFYHQWISRRNPQVEIKTP